MKNRIKCYIYGAGAEYNRLSSYMGIYERNIEVIGIVTTKQQPFKYLDSIPCIRPEEMQVEKMDYVIIAVQKWKEIYDYLKKLKIEDDKILRSNIFYLPNFDLENYLVLKKNKVSILANTCLGGMIYKELGLKTLSPTISARCERGKDYLEFLNQYNLYLNTDMEELDNTNKWDRKISSLDQFAPKGIIGDKIIWNFPHATNADEAIEKWNKKRKEINYNNIVALMVIYDDDDAEKFEQVLIKRKLGIYYKNLHLQSVLYCPEWKKEEVRFRYRYGWSHYVHRYVTNMVRGSRIDWIKFLNGRNDYLRY